MNTERLLVLLFVYLFSNVALFVCSDVQAGTYPIGLLPTVNVATLGSIYSPLAYLSELSGDDKFVIQVSARSYPPNSPTPLLSTCSSS